MVTMRLSAVKDRRVEEIRADTSSRIPSWALRREYRSTYRSRLAGTEQIVAGKWQGKSMTTRNRYRSLSRRVSRKHCVSVSAIHWSSRSKGFRCELGSPACGKSIGSACRPNFFVVFPEGVLENAPQFYAVVARAESTAASASLQRAVVERFPNVSVIDLTLVLNTLDSILGRVSDAIRVVALLPSSPAAPCLPAPSSVAVPSALGKVFC